MGEASGGQELGFRILTNHLIFIRPARRPTFFWLGYAQ